MDMIRHEAGRSDFEPTLACSSQKLLEDELD